MNNQVISKINSFLDYFNWKNDESTISTYCGLGVQRCLKMCGGLNSSADLDCAACGRLPFIERAETRARRLMASAGGRAGLTSWNLFFPVFFLFLSQEGHISPTWNRHRKFDAEIGFIRQLTTSAQDSAPPHLKIYISFCCVNNKNIPHLECICLAGNRLLTFYKESCQPQIVLK